MGTEAIEKKFGAFVNSQFIKACAFALPFVLGFGTFLHMLDIRLTKLETSQVTELSLKQTVKEGVAEGNALLEYRVQQLEKARNQRSDSKDYQ